LCACLLSLSWVLTAVAPTPATAVTFQVEITDTIYQVQAADTYADLLLQHQAGNLLSANALTGVSGITAPIEAGVNTDYSMLITTTLNIAVGGTYEFQVGTDWGRGGAASVIYNGDGSVVSEYVTTTNVWWNNDWNDADVFSTIVTLGAGSSYTLGWVGFEDCCGGSASIRFSYNGGAFTTLTETDIAPFVSNPEPSTGLMVALGLVLMSGARRRRSANTGLRLNRDDGATPENTTGLL
jgi:hypothetical protein